jgi:hypothetical protein
MASGVDGKSMGWRLVVALTALAVVAVGVSLALMALSPVGGPAAAMSNRRSVLQPWAACASAVRHQLAGIERVDVVAGPARARWEASGAGVDLSGRATGSEMRPRGFSCHAIRLGTNWQVERLIFTER